MTRAAPRVREESPATAAKTGAAGKPKAAPADTKKEAAKKKGSLLKNKKFLILLVCVLAVAGSAYKILVPAAPPGPPTGGDIVAMDATTLNLTDGHYLKIAVAIQLVAGKGTKDTFQTSQAAELVIDEFSNRSVASLSTNEARKTLMSDLKTRMVKAYPGEVYQLYLTQFVTQ